MLRGRISGGGATCPASPPPPPRGGRAAVAAPRMAPAGKCDDARCACQTGGTGVLQRGRPRILSGVESLGVAHAEDVAAATLGASEWQAEAFRSAVFSSLLRWWCTDREAVDASWASGNWRPRPAAAADEPLDLAGRRTGEGALPLWVPRLRGRGGRGGPLRQARPARTAAGTGSARPASSGALRGAATGAAAPACLWPRPRRAAPGGLTGGGRTGG